MKCGKVIKMRARRGDISSGPDEIRLYSFAYDYDKGKTDVASPATFQPSQRHQYSPPFLTIENAEAQTLMDDLWEAGIRPTEAKGSAGAMKAVQNHLKDMRTIAFKKLNITGE